MQYYDDLLAELPLFIAACLLFFAFHKYTRFGLLISSIMVMGLVAHGTTAHGMATLPYFMLIRYLPLAFFSLAAYGLIKKKKKIVGGLKMEMVKPRSGITLQNYKRGISILGSAGSGKTEGPIYALGSHFSKNGIGGVMHDYKDFELTDMLYPIFAKTQIPFHIISFHKIYDRFNPIDPAFLKHEEDVVEIVKVFVDNLLLAGGRSLGDASGKFFNDVAEGLLGGIIWRLLKDYPQFCTLPHAIALYHTLDSDSLVAFLQKDHTSRALADAYIKGLVSGNQTAGVYGTLSNAIKKVTSKRIFMVLSGNDLDGVVNRPGSPSVVSVVNTPKNDYAFGPVVATILHALSKRMSERHRDDSFFLMEEASTIKLLNMHRLPATLRSFNIGTIYVLQDKVQNDIMYGIHESKAILSNLSYQFFGKANDPDTAKYYESFFEIKKEETKSVSSSTQTLKYDTRVTKGEREARKIRDYEFFRFGPGEFIFFGDGEEHYTKFPHRKIKRHLPEEKKFTDSELQDNYDSIFGDIKSMFQVKQKIKSA